MTTATAFWGSSLIGLGGSLLAVNLGMDLSAIACYANWWPSLLILMGLALLLRNDIITRIVAALVGLGLSVLLVSSVASCTINDDDCKIEWRID